MFKVIKEEINESHLSENASLLQIDNNAKRF